MPMRPLLISLRPRQWVKNVFVLPAVLFSGHLGDPSYVAVSMGAIGCFCVLSSAVYLLNDVADAEQDRLHPRKALRPIASGALRPSTALSASAVLVVASLGFAWFLRPLFALVAGVYLGANLAYSLWLKRVVVVDIMLIAAGFLLRALGGAVVIDVPISPWFILCSFTLALFLAAIKRRQELTMLEQNASSHRSILEDYTVAYLDQIIAILTAATLVCYALYAMGVGQAAMGHARHMEWTIPFVLYGLLRYLYLVYRTGAGDSPTAVIWQDRALQADMLLWALSSVASYYYAGG